MKKEGKRIYDKSVVKKCREGFSPNYALQCSQGTYCLISDKYICVHQKDNGKYLMKCERW